MTSDRKSSGPQDDSLTRSLRRLSLLALICIGVGGASKVSIAAPFSLDSAEVYVRAIDPGVVRPADVLPQGAIAREDVTYVVRGGRPLQLDVYEPGKGDGIPAILIVHGGGWEEGDRRMERPMAKRFAGLGYAAIPVSYRLGVDGRFPNSWLDLRAAVSWIREHAREYRIDPKKIAIMGASAGGQLAALVGASNGEQIAGDVEGVVAGGFDVDAAIDIDGVADFTGQALLDQQRAKPGAPTRFLGGTIAQRPEVWREASPLFHVSRRSAPTLFLCSTARTPILPGRPQMRDALEKLGVRSEIYVVQNTPHPFWLFDPWQTIVLRKVDQFLGSELGWKR